MEKVNKGDMMIVYIPNIFQGLQNEAKKKSRISLLRPLRSKLYKWGKQDNYLLSYLLASCRETPAANQIVRFAQGVLLEGKNIFKVFVFEVAFWIDFVIYNRIRKSLLHDLSLYIFSGKKEEKDWVVRRKKKMHTVYSS